MEVAVAQQELKVKKNQRSREESRKKQSVRDEKIIKRRQKQCGETFRSLKMSPFLCLLQMMTLLSLFAGISFLAFWSGMEKDFSKFPDFFENWKFEFFFFISVFVFLLSVFIIRLVESSAINRRIDFDKLQAKEILSEMNPSIQEVYIGLHWRKCVHYWMTVAVGSFALIALIYSFLFCGGMRLRGGEKANILLFNVGHWTDKLVLKAFYEKESYDSFFDWTIKLPFAALVIIILNSLQYVFFSSKNKRRIDNFEMFFGKEKLVNDCLLCYRLNKINKKYKILTFSFVCFFGCLVYLFFKRAICIVFDKSFGV